MNKRIVVIDGVVVGIMQPGTFNPDKTDAGAVDVVVNLPVFAGWIYKAQDGTFTAPEKHAASVDEVKAEAGRRILEKLPAWKQSNHIAREAELIATEGGHLRDSFGVKLPARELTETEVTELVYIKTLWDWVKSVRAASGVIEQSPPPINQLKTDNRWPA